MSTAYDLQRYASYHTTTFDGYIYSEWDYYTNNAYNLARRFKDEEN